MGYASKFPSYPLDIDLTEVFPTAMAAIYGRVVIGNEIFNNAVVLNFPSRAALGHALNAGVTKITFDDDSIAVILTDF